jgi:hypothetical protein
MPFLTKGKTNWRYILIVGILSILVGGGILGYLRYFEKEILSLIKFSEIKKAEKVKEGTANWKTYRNLKWNYEIKYPRNFYAMDVYGGDTGAISNVELPEYEEGSITWMGREVVVFGAKNGILVTINYAGKTEKPLEKWLKEEYPQLDLTHYKSVYIAGENALLNREEFYNECLSGSLGECELENAPRGNFIDYDIYFLKNSNIFNIKAQIKMENKEYEIIFNQMLSTFRFLE